MSLINTNGLVLIGPGSEWFWTALSGLVLAVTFFAIYRQLRLQPDVAATEQVSSLLNEWSSERMCRAKLMILMALDAGTEPLDLPDRAYSHIGWAGPTPKRGDRVARGRPSCTAIDSVPSEAPR
jgi:hypothetical protein